MATCLVVLAMLGLAAKIVLLPTTALLPTADTAPTGVGAAGGGPAPSPAATDAAAARGAAAPPRATGAAMPRGDLPGWHQVFTDDFTGDLDAQWGTYDGQPGGDPGGWFDPSHVRERDGILTIEGSRGDTPGGRRYITGGLSNAKVFSQTYGRFAVRFRMDPGYGIAYVIQLWPTDDNWPPEIDFAENDGKTTYGTSASMHFGPDGKLEQRWTPGDFSTWHVVEVEWDPGKVIYRLDGEVWATMVDPQVPDTPMSIAMQTQAWYCGYAYEACPNETTPDQVNLQVDWVVAYAATR